LEMREWRVASLAEIDDPGAREFRAGDGDWPFRGFVVRWQGAVYAYANSCAHLGHPLNLDPEGFFNPDRTLLLCSSHGAVFEPDTGLCAAGPCVGASLRGLAVRVADGEIYVAAPETMRGN
jgi:nitrite reductase/ring-hydroxylating ferredoxin subunit